MIDLETLIGRVWELEGKYDLLLRTHQELVHAYEELKVRYEEATKPAWKPKYPYDNS